MQVRKASNLNLKRVRACCLLLQDALDIYHALLHQTQLLSDGWVVVEGGW